MGDLMTSTTTFDKLVKTYNNFLTPAMKVKVNNKEIRASLKAGITDMDVTLMLDEASSANFTLTNVYDLEKRAFTSGVTTNLVLGAPVSVELGYGSSFTQVFSGYVSNLTMDFTDMPTINVTALDIRRLMMDNVRNNYRYEVKNYSDVATKIFSSYKKVCSKTMVDATSDALTQVMQNGSDYDFVKNVLCPKANREFVVMGGTAYFRKAGGTASPIMTLEWGKALISFSGSVSYCNEMIAVFGHNDAKKEDIAVKKSVKSDNGVKTIVSPLPIREIQSSDVDSTKKANELLAFEASERLKSLRSGNGTCLGLPELIPGRYIKIDKLDASVNKTYYLKQVKHLFGEDGFTTQFEIGGWK